MTKKVIGTCDCFLDLWIGLSYSLFDYHDFRRRCYDVCEKICFICEARDSEHLGKKIVTIVLFCLSCAKFSVNLFGVPGMKERILIGSHRKNLHSNYSNSCNEFFSDSYDTDFSDNDQENRELITNQFRHSFCITELGLYNFKYTRLCCNCRETFKMVFEPKLHNVSL